MPTHRGKRGGRLPPTLRRTAPNHAFPSPPLSLPSALVPMSPESKPAVTVLSGFLGAGKTTVLRHLLRQTEGERWALVVNDVGSINMDARLLKGEALGDGAQVYELGQGCICCSIRDDLAETVCRLAAEGSYHRILVETTGVAEPRAIAGLFVNKNLFGRSVDDFTRLDALVTVVDAADFGRRWRGHSGPRQAASGPRDLVELLFEQVECADLIVLNKSDLAAPRELDELETGLRGLNAGAEILRTELGQVPREWILGRSLFARERTLAAARWISELNTAAAPAPAAPRPARPSVARVEPDYTARYGLRSFLFHARQPFAQARLDALLRDGLPGILRAKGLLWIAERPDETAFLSLTGSTTRIDWLSWWWAALIENGKARPEERPEPIRRLWVEPHGDRRQELVLIGSGYDEPRLRSALEACLLPAPLPLRSGNRDLSPST